MDIKRKAARGIAVLAVALGAGHFVQSMGHEKAPRKSAAAELTQVPTKIETVAAGPEAVKPTVAAIAPAPTVVNVTPGLPEAPLVAPATQEAKTTPEPAALPEPVAEVPVVAAEAMPCDITLDLMAEPSAIIGITLLAPCQPNQRVVLGHAGLAVTGQTTATGALFTGLPAFETNATVSVAFADGTKAESQIAMPDLSTMRRFGVQWQGDDAFQVHGFENGAGYDQPGDISAKNPNRPAAGLPAVGGFLTLAGDSSAENPLLAEIYTFPADPAQIPEVVVEAAVTDKTCGRELLGEVLTSTGGAAYVTDLTLAMPDCDAIGDYLVLKNLVPDLNMASMN